MTVTDAIRSVEGYTVYRPVGECSLETVATNVTEAIQVCRERKVKRLLIDISQLSGFKPPTTMQRYEIASAWAFASTGAIKIAFLFRPEILDPQRFGMTVATNRGMRGNVFLVETEALAWLLDPKTD
jgi:hypothetical protein